jgi:hypothetical protein
MGTSRLLTAVCIATAACVACHEAASVPEASSGDAGGNAVPTAPPGAATGDGDAGAGDGGADGNTGVFPAIDASAMTPCPATGLGGFSASGALCFNFTPADTGEPSTGENATLPHYALRPSAAAPPSLVLFFIGSGGKPSGALKAGPSTNLYAAAIAAGRSVLGLAYKNTQSIGSICQHDDSCFFPTRQSIILGRTEPGSGITVTPDEGIVDRTARALRYLAAGDPSGGWGAFLNTEDPNAPPETAIDWTKILAVGHSQGGGHATAIGKLFPVSRVVQLSSTCDSVDSSAASWTDGTSGRWATDPTQFYGFAAPTIFGAGGAVTGGDTTCPYHTQNWTNLGIVQAHRNNRAATCGETGDTHDASLRCADNYADWLALLQ